MRTFASPGKILTRSACSSGRLLVETSPISLWFVTGFGFSDPGGGVTTASLPQGLEIDFNNTGTTALFNLNAYTWIRGPQANVSGVGDPSLEVVQRLWCSSASCDFSSDAISISGGVSVPSGSAVSAGTAGQAASVIWGHRYLDDRLRVTVRLDRANEVPYGLGRYATTGVIYYQHDFNPDLDAFASLAFTYQGGAGSVTIAGAGFDFPIWSNAFGPFSNVSDTLLGSCALSGSKRCGRVELDFVFAF